MIPMSRTQAEGKPTSESAKSRDKKLRFRLLHSPQIANSCHSAKSGSA
jgi:hypothetical protein